MNLVSVGRGPVFRGRVLTGPLVQYDVLARRRVSSRIAGAALRHLQQARGLVSA
jgi:hypothetical protein